jgi:serine/threonine-protein kinase
MPVARDLSGSVLDERYELHAVIGEGAFGRVYRGSDRRLGRLVAIKVIKPWWSEDRDWVETFEHEAQLLARVSDPGIVQIFDVGHAPEGLYYVAEFVNGESLASRLRRGPLPPSEACDVAEQLCRALAHVHAQRIVHRDVKPANVLISARGLVKLGDFGVARLAEGSTGDAGGTVVGTPRYMAPEQGRGSATTPATDIYSVGIVLYEMLAGAPPFTGESAVELALGHLNDAPPPLPADTADVLVEIVERALAKDPAERFESGEAMATALGRARGATLDSEQPDDAITVSHDVPGTGATATLARPVARERAKADPTRVAPRMTPRRNLNPSARRRSIALLAVAFTLLGAMISAALLLASADRVHVPALRGLSRAAVIARTHKVGIHPTFTHLFDSSPPGTVIAQVPSAGARVDRGSTLRVTLSGGPPPVKVPRLVGQGSAPARAILTSLGLSARTTSVPAPGLQPGTVTGQTPLAGKYLASHGSVALSIAETPSWRPLTSFAGSGSSRSVPFTVRGSQWRIVYRMSYIGTCAFIVFCSGPSARVVGLSPGSTKASFDLSDGGSQTNAIDSGAGTYQVRVTPGSDNARWSMEIQDYY